MLHKCARPALGCGSGGGNSTRNKWFKENREDENAKSPDDDDEFEFVCRCIFGVRRKMKKAFGSVHTRQAAPLCAHFGTQSVPFASLLGQQTGQLALLSSTLSK